MMNAWYDKKKTFWSINISQISSFFFSFSLSSLVSRFFVIRYLVDLFLKMIVTHIDKIKFLKHIVLHQSIRVNSTKIKTIIKRLKFKIIKEVWSFIDLTNYYWKFIFEYSKCIAVLMNITNKNLTFIENAETKKAFTDFKTKNWIGFILTNFDFEWFKIVKANAFDREINEIYSQKNTNNKLKVVAFYSKKLSFTKQNYKIYDKILLIIVKCFKKWQMYFEKIKLKI